MDDSVAVRAYLECFGEVARLVASDQDVPNALLVRMRDTWDAMPAAERASVELRGMIYGLLGQKGKRMTSTKNEGVSALEKAGEDEPLFVLRAQDKLAPEIVREWAYRAQCEGAPLTKCDEARRIADAMEQWQIANRRKVPD